MWCGPAIPVLHCHRNLRQFVEHKQNEQHTKRFDVTLRKITVRNRRKAFVVLAKRALNSWTRMYLVGKRSCEWGVYSVFFFNQVLNCFYWRSQVVFILTFTEWPHRLFPSLQRLWYHNQHRRPYICAPRVIKPAMPLGRCLGIPIHKSQVNATNFTSGFRRFSIEFINIGSIKVFTSL